MSRCLIVGRTSKDVEECRFYGLAKHGPAQSTIHWNNYEMFDGDVITCHTIKFGAKWAVSVDPSARTEDSAKLFPKQIVVGTSPLHHNISQSLFANAIVLHHGPDMRYPDRDTGEFALWFAWKEGYKEIYTVGLDMLNDREKQARVSGMVRMMEGVSVYKANEYSQMPVPIKEPPTI